MVRSTVDHKSNMFIHWLDLNFIDTMKFIFFLVCVALLIME